MALNRIYPAAVIAASLAITAAGCSAHHSIPSEGARIDFEEIDDIKMSVPCQDPVEIPGDLHFFGEVRGLICPTAAGDGFFMYVYESRDHLALRAPDWVVIRTSDQETLLGENWLAVGHPDDLMGIAKAVGVDYVPATALPPASEPSIDESNMAMCMSALVEIIEDQALGKRNPTTDPQSFEILFPGLGIAGDDFATEITSSGGADDGDLYMDLLTRIEDLRAFCSDASDYESGSTR